MNELDKVRKRQNPHDHCDSPRGDDEDLERQALERQGSAKRHLHTPKASLSQASQPWAYTPTGFFVLVMMLVACSGAAFLFYKLDGLKNTAAGMGRKNMQLEQALEATASEMQLVLSQANLTQQVADRARAKVKAEELRKHAAEERLAAATHASEQLSTEISTLQQSNSELRTHLQALQEQAQGTEKRSQVLRSKIAELEKLMHWKASLQEQSTHVGEG